MISRSCWRVEHRRHRRSDRQPGKKPAQVAVLALLLALHTGCATPTAATRCEAYGPAPLDYKGRIIRNPAARRDFHAANPCPANGNTYGACPEWVVDHIIALKSGGPDHTCNMQWQTIEAAKIKDRVE